MEKPFSVTYREAKKAIADTLNESGLPLDAMVSILKDLLQEAETKAELIYQQELKEYKENENGDSDKTRI